MSEKLLGALSQTGYQITTEEIVDEHALRVLVPEGLKVLVVCLGGRITSRDVARTLVNESIPVASLSEGVLGMYNLHNSEIERFNNLVEEMGNLDAIVSLLGKRDWESLFPALPQSLTKLLVYKTGREVAQDHIRGMYRL